MLLPSPTSIPRAIERQWSSHRWLVVGAAIVLVLAILVAVVHTPPVRSAVLSWATDLLAESGVRATAGRLDYNLATLSGSVHDLTLAADGADVPFFHADAVRIDLPWRVALGGIAVESLEIDRPRIAIVRREDGTLNLPDTGETESDVPMDPIQIDRLLVQNFELRLDDRMQDLEVDGSGITLDLRREPGAVLDGRLSMADTITVRLQDTRTQIASLGGRLAFDGTALTLDGLALESPEAGLRLDGTVAVLNDIAFSDLRYEGRLTLERLAPWAAIEPAPTGVVRFSGAVNGPLEAVRATVDLAGNELAWSGLSSLSIQADATVSGSTATVQSFRAGVAGGEIAGEAQVPLDDSAAGRARVRWRDIGVGPLVSALVADPPRIGSIASGTAALDWSGGDVLAGSGSIESLLRAPDVSRRALAVAGRAVLTLDAGTWRLTHDHRLGGAAALTGTAGGRIDQQALPASTLSGSLAVRIDDLADTLQRVRAAGIELDADLVSGVRGDLTADASLAGTIEAPSATGTFTATGLRYGETGPGQARAEFAASLDRVRVDPLEVAVGANTIAGQATIDLEAGTLRGALTADLPQVAELASAVPAAWRPEGSARLEARVSGALDNPTASAVLTSDGLRVAGQIVRRVQSSVQLSNNVVRLETFTLAQDEGQLTASGRYALSSGRYAVEVAGDGLAIAPMAAGEPEAEAVPLDARFDVRFRGEGTLDAPEGDGYLEFSRLSWDGYQLGSARLDVAADGATVRMTARAPELAATLEAQVGIDAPQAFTANLALANADLAQIARPAGPAGTTSPDDEAFLERVGLDGALGLQATASGRLDDLEAAAVDLNLRLVDVAINGAPVRLERPARLRYDGGAVMADDFALRIGDTVLSARGRLAPGTPAGDGLRIALTGSLSDLVPLAQIAPELETVSASGAIDLQARASGGLTAPAIDADISLTSAAFASGTLPPVSDVALQASYADGLLDLRRLTAAWQGATLSASGQVPARVLGDALPEAYLETLPPRPGPARATLRIESLTQSALAPFVSEDVLAEIAGRFDAVVAVEAASIEVEDIRAEVTLERAELELARVPLSQAQPTRLRLANGRLDIVEWTWTGAGNKLNLAGNALLTGESPALDLAATGTLDLRMLGAFAPEVVTNGLASLDVRVTGLADEPAVDGQVSVERGGLILRDPRFAITDLTGVIDLGKDALQLRDITANANGGTLRIAGDIQYPGLELAGGTLTITGRGLAFEVPDDLRSEIDADLTFLLSEDAPSLRGSITILRGSYREPVSLAAQLLTGVETRSVAPADTGEPGFADRIALGIDVRSADDIIIDNNYGRLDIAGNLRIIGTAAAPVLTGRLTVREGGDVYLGGRAYEVVRGTVDFTSATRIEPNIDLALQTRVQRHDITLEVTGTPETIEANLRSPGLSQADVVSLLLTGQLADDSAAAAQGEIARNQLLMLLSGELLGFAGRAVGLDSVQISSGLGGAASDFDLLATDTDPSARLTIGKQLSRDVELVFSQSLSDTGDITWIALYRPLRSVEVRGTTQDDGSRSYEFRHELTFGGSGAGRPAQPARPERADERVAAVRIAGTPGFDEREIRDVLDLESGDRFDFYDWQQDRDRLQRFYRERGFFEARISARRGDAAGGDAAGVTLEYDIERGPLTTFVVDGYQLPGSLMERMEDAWVWAVFDGFLLDDLTSMVKARLTEDGHIQAEVTAEVTSEPDAATKTIALRIAPGTRYTDRRISFTGQTRFSADALTEAVRARGVGAAMWQDPTDLRTALEQHYRANGYLAAAITVGAPTFNGQSASLPVRVDEGPLFTIGRVDVAGAEARPAAEVRQAFDVQAGAPYIPGLLEPARREVELGYLREGYNDVNVSVTALVDDERASVGVVLTVREGQQKILADVTVSGAEITNRGVIDRALDLEPGQPANLTDFYRAEKRLYDTGAFRTADIVLEPIAGTETGPVEQVRATVNLEELSPYRFRYGFRVNDSLGPIEAGRELKPALVVDLLRRNLFGRAIAAGLAGQVEADRRLARGIVSLPQFFGLPVTTNFFLTTSRQDFTPEGATPFVEDESGVTAEQRFRPTTRMVVSYGYNFSRTHVFEPEPVPGLPGLELQAKVARLTGTYAWDRRDDPFNARSGMFHSSGLELGAASLGSDLRFVRYLAQQYYFKTVRERFVLASAARLGLGRGFDRDLIPSEKFFAGGGTSVRGFAEDALGGVDFLGDPVGGNSMLVFIQELRFPIYKWARGVTFVDAGNVFPTAGDISVTDLEAGAGLGLRIDSPFALIRIDFGVPLTKRARQPSGRWYVGIGQTF